MSNSYRNNTFVLYIQSVYQMILHDLIWLGGSSSSMPWMAHAHRWIVTGWYWISRNATVDSWPSVSHLASCKGRCAALWKCIGRANWTTQRIALALSWRMSVLIGRRIGRRSCIKGCWASIELFCVTWQLLNDNAEVPLSIVTKLQLFWGFCCHVTRYSTFISDSTVSGFGDFVAVLPPSNIFSFQFWQHCMFWGFCCHIASM